MEFVEPIREKAKILAMKRVLFSNPRDYLLFVLGINSGLRISDLLKIKVKHVIDDRGKLRSFHELRESKSGKAKKYRFNKNAQKALEDYLKNFDGSPDDVLFMSRKGSKAITPQHAWHVLSQAAKTVGIKERIGTHTLRKTFAYHLYSGGTDLSLLQKLLNHSSPSVTLRYIGITQDQMDREVEGLNL